MNKKYDLAVAYRIYPGVSKIPAIHNNNKYELSRVCLESFFNSIKNINAYIYIILDGCPDEYKQLFQETLIGIDYEFIENEGIGNAKTFQIQIDLLLSQDKSEVIYFAEDDYFYLENAFPKMIEVIKDARIDFLSPYDHPDAYTFEIHNYKKNYLEISNSKWVIVSGTTLTFMTTKEMLKETKKIFETYTRRNYDASLWMSMTKLNTFNLKLMIKFLFTSKPNLKIYLKIIYFNLFTALFGKKRVIVQSVPALATHIEKEFLSHNVDWYKEFEKYETK